MFKFKSNCLHYPMLRFIETPADSGGGDGGGNEDLGFPKDTPTSEMTDEQKAAYWHNQSKVQQKAREAAERQVSAYQKFGSVEDLQSAADAAEQARLAALDDNERALETARQEARAEAEREANSRHLAAAVSGMLIARTISEGETFEDAQARIAGAIQFADLSKFVGDNGELDAEKIQTFAQSIGSAGSNNSPQNPNAAWGQVYNQIHDGRIQPQQGATGSVASYEQAAYEKKKKTA
ncbi:hypothetical protein [Microbacterium sp. YY-01]|uniref:hypothetical protein n=1 Tax=Microbacterium sp. YY-01 TaxID=3421634 RepID=UPI003D16C88D